jgi:hypothetical protein
MTTLREIITADESRLWRDNAGDVWNADTILEQWGDDLDREASCVGGTIQYIGEDGDGAGAVLSEIDNKHLHFPFPSVDESGYVTTYETWADISLTIDLFALAFLDMTEEENQAEIRSWAEDGEKAITAIKACYMVAEFPAEAYQRWARESLLAELWAP